MFSEPVIGDKFFGREEVLDLLNKRALGLQEGYRQNIALTGQSLSGKSSIILHFLHSIKEENFIPIYVEVVKEPFRSFVNKFVATMLYHALAKMGVGVSADIDSLLEQAREHFPKTYFAIKHVHSSIDHGDLDEAYLDLLGLTSALKEEAGTPCIVILDEFDNLEHLGIKNPFLSFGKVIMIQKDTMYIVSSSRDSVIKKIISEKLSLLFGNFEVVKIGNFSLSCANSFIDSKLGGFDIEDGVRAFLVAFTDGNPFYLDKIAARAKAVAIERMSSYIDKDVVSEAILELVYNASGSIHQYLLNYVLDLLDTKNKDRFLSIMVAISNGQNKQPDIARALRVKRGEVSKALVALQELALISKNGVFYKIDDVMLEFWLTFVYQRRKNMLIDGVFDKRGMFLEDIGSYVCGFIKESEMNVVSRIAELFNVFSNDLVQIETKSMRLPHFTKVEVRTFANSQAFIAASFRGNYWIVEVCETYVGENDIIEFIKNLKSLKEKVSNKVIIPLKGIDENAKLLAKELKMSIWSNVTVNMLLGFHGKKRIVSL